MRFKIILYFYLLVLFKLVSANSGLYFKHLTVDDGLLYNIVENAVEDKHGIMWFSTSAGVCKYNGFEFEYYKNDPSDSTSLSYNLSGCMLESKQGDLFICTRGGGLNIYNRETDDFTIFRSSNKNGSLSNDDCESIFEDSRGNIWIGTHHGLDLFQPNSGTFINYYPLDEQGKEKRISIHTIHEDDRRNLWIGTLNSGLYIFNLDNCTFQKCTPVPGPGVPGKISIISDIADYSASKFLIASGDGLFLLNKDNYQLEYFSGMGLPEKIARNFFHVILRDTRGQLWVGSDIGLIILNAYENTFSLYQYTSDNPRSLTNNDIRDLYQDSNGNIWICTRNGGVNIYDEYYNSFGYLSFQGQDKNLITNNINCFSNGSNNILWIGTTGGLIKYNYNKHSYKIYNYHAEANNTLGENNIMALFEASDRNLWIGGKRNGITLLDIEARRFRAFNLYDVNEIYVKPNEIIDIIEDFDKNVWVATSGEGLLKYNITKGYCKQYLNRPGEPGSLSNNWLTDLYLDKDSNIWAATTYGVNLYNKNKDQFKKFFQRQNKSSLSINHVRTVHQDDKGYYWFGTYGGGLNKYDPVSGTFILYNEKKGLSGDIVQGILEDDNGNLWISTNNGITRLNTTTGHCEQYDVMDGLQGNNFNSNAHFKSQQGVFYFGGNNGVTFFDPKEIRKNNKQPEVYISNVKIYNQDIDYKGCNQPFLPGEIELNYKQSFLTFDFFAIDFSTPYKTRYKFFLEGLEDDWNQTDAYNREVSYSNVPPGNYVFRVIASNGDGVWNEKGDELKISIAPPFWKTKIAYGVYFLLLVMVLIGIRRYVLLKERIRNAQKLEKLEHEKLHEIDQFKLKLYTNVYHDLRTPLTLILGPLNDMATMEEASSNTKIGKYIGIMKKNAARLLRLLNQLMDIRKIETGNYKLELVKGDLIAFVKEIYHSFQPSMQEKQIDFKYESTLDQASVCFDPKIIETILSNLLSNAGKFTAEGGKIMIKLEHVESGTEDARIKNLSRKFSNGFYEITVQDNGRGIAKDDLPHIFTRFYRAQGAKKSAMGSGIGLSLTKDFTELHHGTIEVESSEGKGTLFRVCIPSDEATYNIPKEEINEFSIDEYLENKKGVAIDNYHNEKKTMAAQVSPQEKTEKFKVLIVEDNAELRQYITDYLTDNYELLEAENGRIAFEIAANESPSIIISDIMMPEMNGFELCKKIKTTENTSHIPVLLLTSLSDNLNKMEGLETGADEYVTKPFDIKILALRVRNLIESRVMLKKKFSSEITLSPKDITITPIDEVFLKKTMDIIEENMSDPEFTVDDLVREVGMSRSLFYLKIKELTGQPAKEFIKSMRLKRAAQYIMSNQYNVSEVAFMVGFKDPKYFSKCFEKQFGTLPKNYKAQIEQNNPATE